MRPPHGGRIWASQGGLSRNKVAVGESAAGSPPNERDQADGLTHTCPSLRGGRRGFLDDLDHFGGRAPSNCQG